MTAAQAYNWCGHDPVNHCDPNGHSWYGLILTTISAFVWALQLTTVSIELEIFNLIAEILQWFPVFRPFWGWDGYKKTSVFNISPPVASSRLNVPFAFVLNGLLTNLKGGVWTLGNIVWAQGSQLRGLEKSAKRDLLICSNASTYVAATSEIATTSYGARSPFVQASGTADATGTTLTAVTITAPPGSAVPNVFRPGDSISVRKTGDPNDEIRQISSLTASNDIVLNNALPSALFGQAVEVKRIDYESPKSKTAIRISPAERPSFAAPRSTTHSRFPKAFLSKA